MADESDGEGNRIVPVPPEKGIPFPTFILAGLIVGAGIYLVDQINSRAAWALAFLVLLTVAFSYKSFGTELTGILTGKTDQPPAQGNAIVPVPETSGNGIVGPVGPITTQG